MRGKSEFKRDSNLVTVGEATEILGISRETLCRWRKNCEHLPFIKVGSRYFYDREELELFLRGELEGQRVGVGGVEGGK